MNEYPQCSVLSAMIALLPSLIATGAEESPARRPAMLVHAPHGQSYFGVDVGFLSDLHASGIEVDYTDRHREFTWERIKNYNVLIITECPGPEGEHEFSHCPIEPPWRGQFVDMIERFLDLGGGVFYMADDYNISFQYSRPLTENWNVDLPIQHIVDDGNTAFMTRFTYFRLCFTEQIAPSPVSDGVRQIWFPYGKHYNAGMTVPLVLGPEWQAVVKAMLSARTERINVGAGSFPPPTNVRRDFPLVTAPPIFAIRTYKKGRLALSAMYPTFTFGQGTKWRYNREVLSRGLQERPSHFAKLIENTVKWLAEPSLRSDTLGGHTTDTNRLRPTNARPEVKERFEEQFWGEKELSSHRPATGRLHRGLVGIKTKFSVGAGTVQEYAQAAKELGLDFIVLMDDFDKLNEASCQEMKQACQAASDSGLLVLPGYAIDNNIGNHLFLYGPDLPWPEPAHLTGPDGKLLNQQYQSPDGEYERKCPVLNWILTNCLRRKTQTAFYNFTESGSGMRMEHLRTYGMAALWFYRDGKLVEDKTKDYLLTAQGCVPPSPAVVNIICSPEELRREVIAGRGLIYARGKSLDTLYTDALRYPGTYDAPNIFPSTGPMIRAWPECFRVHTFAAEDFVTGRNLMPSPIHVTSDVGLKEIRIYDGTDLYRRFVTNGAKEFRETLVLDGTVQRNLVLIAEEVDGGKAISYARRTRKIGDMPEYCSDRVNIGSMYLAHGPNTLPMVKTPAIHGGFAFDGTPEGILPLASMQYTQPLLTTQQGDQEGREAFNQVPLLETSDEGAMIVRSVRDELIHEKVAFRSMSPWVGYGPIVPSKLFEHTQQLIHWHHETKEVHPTDHAGFNFGYGAIPTAFTTWIRLKRDVDVKELRLFFNGGYPHTLHPWAVVSRAGEVEFIELDGVTSVLRYALEPGDWFGFFSRSDTNSNIFTVRDTPLRLELRGPKASAWVELFAELDGQRMAAGAEMTYGMATMTFPVDAEINSGEQLVSCVQYLQHPAGLDVNGARRLASPGVLEYAADDHKVEIRLPKPDSQTLLTLPFRCAGMNRRWSAGLWLRKGYVLGHYGDGQDRYRPLGIDLDGRIYVPIAPDLAEIHHVVAGHPVVADAAGQELFLQVTQVSGGTGGQPHTWHVSVNNPLDRPVTATIQQNIDLPGLDLEPQTLTFQPGEYRVLVGGPSHVARAK